MQLKLRKQALENNPELKTLQEKQKKTENGLSLYDHTLLPDEILLQGKINIVSKLIYVLGLRMKNTNGIATMYPQEIVEILNIPLEQFKLSMVELEKNGFIEAVFWRPEPPVTCRFHLLSPKCDRAGTPLQKIVHRSICYDGAPYLDIIVSFRDYKHDTFRVMFSEGKKQERETEKKSDGTEILLKKEPTESAIEWLDYWNNSGMRKHEKLGSQTRARALTIIQELLNGTFFNKKDHPEISEENHHSYTFQEFALSVDRAAQAATDPEVLPINKSHLRSLSLETFVYTQYSREIKSYFLHYLTEEPKLKEPLLQNSHPSIVKAMQEMYIEKVTGGIKKEFSVPDINSMIRGSYLIVNFIRVNSDKLESQLLSNPQKIGEIFWLAFDLVSGGNIKKITPHWFSASWVTSKFPEVLNQIGATKTSTHRRIGRLES